jgi:hypothetical protein
MYAMPRWTKLGCKQRIILARNTCSPCLQRTTLVSGITDPAAWHLTTVFEFVFTCLHYVSCHWPTVWFKQLRAFVVKFVWRTLYTSWAPALPPLAPEICRFTGYLLETKPWIVAGLALIHYDRYVIGLDPHNVHPRVDVVLSASQNRSS